MVSIRTVGDRLDNQSIHLDYTSDDNATSWSMTLVTRDLTQIMLDNPGLVSARIEIVDGDDLGSQSNPNSFMLPVELAGVLTTQDNRTKFFYRQRFDSKREQLSPQLTLDGFVIHDQSDAKSFDNPFIMVSFSLDTTSSSRQQGNSQMDRQQFSGTRSDDETGDMSQRGPHTYDDEIGNGGLDLATTGDNRNQHEDQTAEDLNRQTEHQDA